MDAAETRKKEGWIMVAGERWSVTDLTRWLKFFLILIFKGVFYEI